MPDNGAASWDVMGFAPDGDVRGVYRSALAVPTLCDGGAPLDRIETRGWTDVDGDGIAQSIICCRNAPAPIPPAKDGCTFMLALDTY